MAPRVLALATVGLLVLGGCGSSATPSPSASAAASVAPSAQPSPSAAPSAVASGSPSPSAATITYTVKKGDTLYALAIKFHTTVKAIQAANPSLTNPNYLKVGQKLEIPTGK